MEQSISFHSGELQFQVNSLDYVLDIKDGILSKIVSTNDLHVLADKNVVSTPSHERSSLVGTFSPISVIETLTKQPCEANLVFTLEGQKEVKIALKVFGLKNAREMLVSEI